jgi:hypothetical protein
MLSQNLIEAGEVFVNRLSTEELLELFGIVPDKNQNSDIANS